jgi:hypothetical protein
MEMRPLLQIQTIIKAISEDVIPALDQSNQLAMQSAHPAICTLTLISQHLPLEYRYDCDELARLLRSGEVLRSQAKGGEKTSIAVAQLKEAGRIGSDVLDRAKAEPSEVLDAIHRLRTATAEAVRAVYDEGSDSAQRAVGQTVLAMSKEQLLRDRAWLIMQGWEPDPKAIPAIDTLLAPVGSGA